METQLAVLRPGRAKFSIEDAQVPRGCQAVRSGADVPSQPVSSCRSQSAAAFGLGCVGLAAVAAAGADPEM
jgi:hypothetical protein